MGRCLVLAVLLFAGPYSEAAVVDRVVVVVEEDLVMLSDIELEAALAEVDRSTSPFWAPTHENAQHRLVDAAVIRQLAGDVQIYVPSEALVRSRVERIRADFADRSEWLAFLERWGLDEAELRVYLKRRMVVERYLDRVLAVRPDDTEAWLRACEDHVAALRAGMRIRYVEPR